MKAKLLSTIIISIFLLTLIPAQDISKFEQYVGEELPGIAGTLFGNEKINIQISKENNPTKTIHIVTKDKKLDSVGEGEGTDPTIIAQTDMQTIEQIQESDNILTAFEAALKDGSITYKAVGITKKINFSLLRILVNIINWFK